VVIPASASDAGAIVPFAKGLRQSEQRRIVEAFTSGFYEMGAEFVWRRAMTRLRQTIAALGMDFIAEMLGRTDVKGASSAESVLTDFDTIQLAEQLGIVNTTGALKLRHAFELLSHYAGGDVDEDIPIPDALGIVRACVQFALGMEEMQVAVNFSRFRSELLSRTFAPTDPYVDQLAGSPPFFLSTALRALLAAVRSEESARLQHALENIVVVLPVVWQRLPEQDRWALGKAYAEATASGETSKVAELKRALLKVSGFDYVPENLRSTTYKRAAQEVIDAHFSFGNYEAEIKPTRHLASLGTAIPKPAVGDCVRAYLLVFLGNPYGYSFAAAPTAREQLTRLSATIWEYFLKVVLPTDENLLAALGETKPSDRFVELASELHLPTDAAGFPPNIRRLLLGATSGHANDIRKAAVSLHRQYKTGGESDAA